MTTPILPPLRTSQGTNDPGHVLQDFRESPEYLQWLYRVAMEMGDFCFDLPMPENGMTEAMYRETLAPVLTEIREDRPYRHRNRAVVEVFNLSVDAIYEVRRRVKAAAVAVLDKNLLNLTDPHMDKEAANRIRIHTEAAMVEAVSSLHTKILGSLSVRNG